MSQPAARISDLHVCPMVTGIVPHVGGPIMPPTSTNVLTGMLFQARMGDKATCVGPPDVIVMGSPTVLVNNMMAARMGDMTAHGGVITLGCFTVLIGAPGADGGGGGGGGGGAGGGPGYKGPAAFDKAMIGATGPLSTYSSIPAPATQAAALIQAASDGAPFCERCANGG